MLLPFIDTLATLDFISPLATYVSLLLILLLLYFRHCAFIIAITPLFITLLFIITLRHWYYIIDLEYYAGFDIDIIIIIIYWLLFCRLLSSRYIISLLRLRYSDYITISHWYILLYYIIDIFTDYAIPH